MGLRVVGAGLGRTGTNSLKLALEQLLGGRCHHMHEVFARADVLIPRWTDAAAGRPDWPAIFDGDVATVDWPAASFWREISDEYPDSLVLLSKRSSAEEWWTSASRTIFAPMDLAAMPPEFQTWMTTLDGIFARVGVDPSDRDASMAAYERHLAAVREAVPAERLVEWTAGDGWEPLCAALDVPVPADPFPHVNTTEEFLAMVGGGGPDAPEPT